MVSLVSKYTTKKRLERLRTNPSNLGNTWTNSLHEFPHPMFGSWGWWEMGKLKMGFMNQLLPASASAGTAHSAPSPRGQQGWQPPMGAALPSHTMHSQYWQPRPGVLQGTPHTSRLPLTCTKTFFFYHCIWGLCFLWKEVRNWKDVYKNYYLPSDKKGSSSFDNPQSGSAGKHWLQFVSRVVRRGCGFCKTPSRSIHATHTQNPEQPSEFKQSSYVFSFPAQALKDTILSGLSISRDGTKLKHRDSFFQSSPAARLQAADISWGKKVL